MRKALFGGIYNLTADIVLYGHEQILPPGVFFSKK